MKIVEVNEKVTSNIFYYNLMPQIHEKLQDMGIGEDFILDFSETKAVDAMAVPLLLNLARWIISTKKTIPQIYIPNFEEKNRLKEYLEQIGFFYVCDFYDYYEVNTERISVLRDSINLATYVFTENARDDSQAERERIEKYVFNRLRNNSYAQFWKYWSEYDISRDPNHPINSVEWMTRSLCANVGIHTDKNAILTLQRNKELRRVCISIADCGEGLYEKLKKKGERGKFEPTLCSFNEFKKLNEEIADLYAIIEALAYRYKEKIYGLYHVLMISIELGVREEKKGKKDKDKGWKIRIHTNQKRMVLTQKNCHGKNLDKTVSKKQFARKLLMMAQSEYVAKKTQYYPGVHIEVEIPYDEEKM